MSPVAPPASFMPHPLLQASPLDHDLASGRFIGSPPPTALRAHESTRDDNGNAVASGRRGSEASSEAGEEERCVYKPANPALEASQPRITLNTAPRCASPPPAHAIVAVENATSVAGSGAPLTLRTVAATASDAASIRQALTPPPKLVTYRAEGGAEAVQVRPGRVRSGPSHGSGEVESGPSHGPGASRSVVQAVQAVQAVSTWHLERNRRPSPGHCRHPKESV